MKKITARRQSTIKSAKIKVVCFGEKITGTKTKTPKIALGSSLGKYFRYRDKFFYDVQQCVTLGMTYDMKLAKPRKVL